MQFNHILNLRHTKIDFLRLKLDVISTPKTDTIKVKTMKAKNYITKVILQDVFMQS